MVQRLVRAIVLVWITTTVIASDTDGHLNAPLYAAKQVATRKGAFVTCGPASTAGIISVDTTGDGRKDVKRNITQQMAQETLHIDMGKNYGRAELNGRSQHQGGLQAAAMDITCTSPASTGVKKTDSPPPSTYRKIPEIPVRFPSALRRGGLPRIWCHTSLVVEHASSLCALGLHSPNMTTGGFSCTCETVPGTLHIHALCTPLSPEKEHAIRQEGTIDGRRSQDTSNCLLTENSGDMYYTRQVLGRRTSVTDKCDGKV
jgi:hypothetical protein